MTLQPIFLAIILLAFATESFSRQTSGTSPFFKTSFDCSKAKLLSIEEAICKNEDLARLDRDTTDAYRKLLGSSNATERERIVASQRRWLAIRDAYDVNPYHGDTPGELGDLSDLYKARIAALHSTNPALLETTVPEEYVWLRATAPEGFSKERFSIRRGYAGCEDPCGSAPSLYRWISISGRGIGIEPGDVDTPYALLAKKMSSEGWTKCRTADDSGTPKIDYFTKGNKIVLVRRYYSMGAGNGIELGIAISDPLPLNPRKPLPNPMEIVNDEWVTYSDPGVGLQLRYPPHWDMRDDSASTAHDQYKNLIFAADKRMQGEFRITIDPQHSDNRGTVAKKTVGSVSPPAIGFRDFLRQSVCWKTRLSTRAFASVTFSRLPFERPTTI